VDSRRGDALFTAALVSVLVVLWGFAAARDGSSTQVPFWDMAWFHVQALKILHEVERDGFLGFARGWVHASDTHAPLVPAASALLMALFGPTRAAAEAVLPISNFFFLFSTMQVARRLFGRGTAYATTALVATFPVCLTYSRLYLFEMTFAACLAAACWALLASERFTRWIPTIAFGAMAGLTALSRAGGFVYLAPPIFAVWLGAARGPGLGSRLVRFFVASLVAGGLAATWYVPNFHAIAGYLTRVTLGENAAWYAPGGVGPTIPNILYYVVWGILDGPGLPMLILTAACLVASRGRALRGGAAVAVAAVVAAIGLIAAASGQRMAGKFLLPVMPGVALLIVRAVVSVPRPALRTGFGFAVAALALHHVVACTFLFANDPAELPFPFQLGASAGDLRILAYHRSFYLDWSKLAGGIAVVDSKAVDYKIPESFERIAALSLPPDSRVAVLAEHVFFSSAPLQVEALRRGSGLLFMNAPDLAGAGDPAWKSRVRDSLAGSGAALLRTIPGGTPFDAAFRDANNSLDPPFTQLGDPIPLGDGSQVYAFRRGR
jgi:hypothetical protein